MKKYGENIPKKQMVEMYIKERNLAKQPAAVVHFDDASSIITETVASTVLSRDTLQEDNEWLAINNHQMRVYQEEML